MNTNARTSRSAFTLVEMLVVLFLIMTLVSVAMPGVMAANRHASQDSTNNIFQSLNDTCVHQARQFGSACLIYGYTVEYGETGAIPGSNSAMTIHPWVITPDGSVQYQDNFHNLRGDIGHGDMWNGDRIELQDRSHPATAVVLNGSTISTSTCQFLHVAYEPRSGFVHAQMNNSSTPSFIATGPGGITSASSTPDQVSIQTYTIGTGVGASTLQLNGTGVLNVQNL